MPPSTKDRLKRVTIGELTVLNGPIGLAESNPEWPEQFARQAEHIQAALGERALRIEHVGSTAVPGLAAKPKGRCSLTFRILSGATGYTSRRWPMVFHSPSNALVMLVNGTGTMRSSLIGRIVLSLGPSKV